MSATPDTARSFRDAAIRRAIGGTLGARVVSVACTLIQVPIALSYLGKEAYGLWVALTSATLLLNVADFGLGAGLQTEAGTALGRGQPARAASLFFTTFVMLAAIAAALALIGVPVVLHVGWSQVFHLTEPALVAAAPRAALALVVLFCAGLPLAAGARLANACQWGWLSGVWAACGSALQLAVVVVAAGLHLGFTTFVWLAGAVPLLSAIGLLTHVLRRLRWRGPDFHWAGADDRKRLIHTGGHFSLLQVGATFIFNAAAPAIGAVAGAPMVASYYVLQRLLGLFPQLQQIAISPTWPGYTDAAARGDGAWIRRTFRLSVLGTLIGVGIPVALLALTAPWCVALLSRSHPLVVSSGLVWTIAGWNVALCLGHPPAHLLGGLGRVKRLAWFSTAGNVVSAICMVRFGHGWGAPGVIAGLITGYVAIGLPGAFLEARAALGDLARMPAR